MRPVFMLCIALIVTLPSADLLSKAHAEPGSLQTDDRGFIDTAARCDSSKSAIAVGRTQQSLVAICVDPRGHYEYRGVRLKDGSEPRPTRPWRTAPSPRCTTPTAG